MLKDVNPLLRFLLFFACCLSIYAGNIFFVVPSQLSSELITTSLFIDFVVWVPALFYVLLYRTGIAGAVWFKPIIAGGIVSALYVAPSTLFTDSLSRVYPYIICVLAVGFGTVTLFKLVKSLSKTKGLRGESRINQVAVDTFGKSLTTDMIKTEWMTAYYAIKGWKSPNALLEKNAFSYHRKSGSRGMILGMTAFHIPSMVFTHVIAAQLWPMLATVLTVLHLYSMFFFVSLANAIQHRPVKVAKGHILLRYGLLFDTELPLSLVEKVERASLADNEKEKGRILFSMFEQANIKITLKQAYPLNIVANITKPCKEIVLNLDEPHTFIRLIEQHKNS